MKLTVTGLILALALLLQENASPQILPADTARIPVQDSVRVQFIRPIQWRGTLDRKISPENTIADSSINWMSYRSAGDLLLLHPGVFMRDFGSLGLPPELTIQGLGGRDILYLSDGISLNSPLTGRYNLYFYPTENIERIEIMSGTKAFLYGLNSTGGAINFLSKSKRAIRPSSRLRYSESGYGFGIVDGMVSQDILRGLNITIGAQHTVYGPRYQNENFDCWNGRVSARYNINDRINLFASEMYTQSLLGMYGGVDLRATPDSLRYESLQATVRNAEAYEKTARHDVQIGFTSRLLPDSEAISSATIYFTTNVRGYRDLENNPLLSNGISLDQFQQTKWFGLHLRQNLRSGDHTAELGADIGSERSHLAPAVGESTAAHVSFFGTSDLGLGRNITLTPSARFDSYRGEKLLSYGCDITVTPLTSLRIRGGYSRSFHIPTFIERSGFDTLLSSSLRDNAPERHHVFEVSLLWSEGKVLTLDARSFHRTIWNPIVVTQETDPATKSLYEFSRTRKKILEGCSGSLRLRIGGFCVEGEVEFLEVLGREEDRTTLPRWSFTGGIFYWDNLLDHHLDLKVGFSGKGFTSYQGEDINLQGEVSIPGGGSSRIPPAGAMDFVILARLGKAYLHFIMDNLLNRKYIMASFYPMPERQMRFGVSWDFLD